MVHFFCEKGHFPFLSSNLISSVFESQRNYGNILEVIKISLNLNQAPFYSPTVGMLLHTLPPHLLLLSILIAVTIFGLHRHLEVVHTHIRLLLGAQLGLAEKCETDRASIKFLAD